MQLPGTYHVTDGGTGPSTIFVDQRDCESLDRYLGFVRDEPTFSFPFSQRVLHLFGDERQEAIRRLRAFVNDELGPVTLS